MARIPAILACGILLFSSALAQVSESQRQVFFSTYTSPPLYGFDYEEDTARSTSEVCTNTNSYDSYFLEGTDDNFAYLAKGLDDLQDWPAKESYKVAFRIKACQADYYESGFAVVWSLEDGTPSGTTKGNGKTTGAFTNSLKVKFHEDGNSWSLGFYQVLNGIETKLVGGSTPRSDEHRLFHFLIDNRAATGPRIELQNYAGSTILSASTDAAFESKPVHGLWFVAYGFSYLTRATVLVAESPSTTIYDTDPRPPAVQGVAFLPSVVDAGESVQVTATVTDDWGIDHVHLIYRINGGANNAVTMTDQGGGAYRGTIPGQDSGDTVRFRIEATDTTGLVGHSQREYSYTVASGDPVDDSDENPNQPTVPGGGTTTIHRTNVFWAAALFLLAGLLVGALIHVQFQRPILARLLVLATLAGVLLYLAWSLNVKGLRSIEPAVWLGAAALVGALYFFTRHRRKAKST